MAADFEIAPATREHVLAVAGDLCPEDVLELDALGVRPIAALLSCLHDSTEAFVIVLDGKPAAMFGVVAQPWGGRLWLLTTTLVRQHRRGFLRAARVAVVALLAQYRVLANEVGIDARHAQALRLARHLGFSLLDPRNVGVHGEPFVPFRQEAA